MYSTPKFSRCISISILGLLMVGGCARMNQRIGDFNERVHERFYAQARPSQMTMDRVSPDPAPDAAASERAWDQQVLDYPNGGVVGGSTYNMNYEDRPRWLDNDPLYAALQPGIVAVDIMAMPFNMVFEPPGTSIMYHGVRYAPSTTVAPPLPPE